jgi:hypothetical protein
MAIAGEDEGDGTVKGVVTVFAGSSFRAGAAGAGLATAEVSDACALCRAARTTTPPVMTPPPTRERITILLRNVNPPLAAAAAGNVAVPIVVAAAAPSARNVRA